MLRFVFVALSLLLVGFGCATLQRDTRARELAGDYVYDKPLSEVWPHVDALLVAHGYTPRERLPFVIETDWKGDVPGSRTSRIFTRYVVVGKDTGGQSVVRIHRSTRRNEHAEANMQHTQDRAVTNDAGGGRSGEQAHYGTNTDTGRVLDHDPDQSATEAIAGNRGGSAFATPSGARDLQMEWLLLQRADPDGAAKIFAQVEGT